jgi:hypothetical protein
MKNNEVIQNLAYEISKNITHRSISSKDRRDDECGPQANFNE